MRRLVALCALVVGCSSSHGLDVDAGPHGDPDVGPIFIGDAGTCPSDIDPYDPTSPHSLCSPEGIRCTSGGSDVCGSFMQCSCEGGHWNCLVAEADPVCWCGRQPTLGDRCGTEGMPCGECCPTAGGTGWPAMSCVDGHWQGVACPATECPVLDAPSCAVDTHTLLGTSCEGDIECGDACCDNAVVCQDGTWQPGPEADCFACTSYACGGGLCREDETCSMHCGPTDAGTFECLPRATGCNDCSCIHLDISERCEMIDGHPHVSTFCG